MRIALLMLLLLSAVQLLAQTRVVVQTQEEYQLFERDARLGLTKAFLENDKDSIRYWRDVELHDESRPKPRITSLVDHRSRTLLNFYLGDTRALLDDIEQGRHYFTGYEWQTLTGVVFDLSYPFALWTDYILDHIETADIGGYEMDLLTVYWMMVLNDVHLHSYGIGYSVNEINTRANALLDSAPEHRMAPFIRDHIRWEYEESRYELGVSTGIGTTFFTDELSPLMDPGFVWNTRLEYLRSRYQLFVDMDFRFAPAARQFALDTLDLMPGDRITWISGSAGGGLILLDGGRGRAILSAGIQGLSITRPIQDTMYTSGFFVQPVGTLSFDLKVGRNRSMAAGWRGPVNEWRGPQGQPTAIRLLLGFTPGALAPGMQYQGGMFFATIGIALHSRMPVRVR